MWKNNRLAILTGAFLLAAWQILSIIVNIEHILPGPIRIIQSLWTTREALFLTHLPPTLIAVLAGFGLSILIGVILAVLMDLSQTLEAMLYPIMVLTQTIPVMCIAPLFVLWFGYTLQARLICIVLSTFFTITVNTFDGFKLTKREMVELMDTYGAGRWHIFWDIKVPTALPNFMTSLKITFPWAVIGAAIAEWLGATQGLGYYSKLMVTRMNGPAVFAAVLVLTMIAILGMALIKWIDRHLVVWRSEV